MRLPLRQIIAWIGAGLGLGLLGSGLFISDTTQWRLQLLAGLWLLSLLPRALLPQSAPTSTQGASFASQITRRSLPQLIIVFVLGFAAVALQLTREQVSQAAAIRTQVAAIFQPVTQQNPDQVTTLRPADRTALGNGRVWPVTISTTQRGDIVDRNGVVLATTKDGRRVYPNPDLGQIVGFDSRLYGTSGVESSFDSYLSGASSLSPTMLLEARLLGTPIQTTAANVHLTLDSKLQQVAQNALGQRKGAVVLMDPQTGALLALASYPRFDPNQLVLAEKATDADVANVQAAWQSLTNRADSPLLNRATQGHYPPGSIIKTLTASAVLDTGVLSGPEGQITCPNQLQTEPGAPPVRNAVENLSARTGDPSNLRLVYAWSCNTAFAQLGLKLGPDRFGDYATRLSLGFADAQSNDPDFRDSNASKGTIAGSAQFLQRPAALADTAYGQGQALVTPLDMAQMVAIVANGGQLMRPYLVQDARAGDRVLYQAKPETLRRVISAQTAQQMRSIMQTSVEIGYAKPVALPGVNIGAKTGTAENPSGVPHSWFVAIAPLEQPRFAIAVIIENGGEGSTAALPVARQVLAAALGIQP